MSQSDGGRKTIVEAFFLDSSGGGQRFCVHHRAQGPVKRGQLLYIHPFAEEMNKARRMAALQARAFAQAGYEVLQIDLLGCGDSSGDFGDATWDAWIEDVLQGLAWLRRDGETAPLWIWGLRAGCLLAVQAAKRYAAPLHLLLVQPTVSGKLALQQFLRLKSAAGLMDGSNKGAMAEMRASLGRGESLEIAGYVLNPLLAHGLESATLQALPTSSQPLNLVWLELSSQPGAAWTPVAAQAHKQWQDAGHHVHAELLAGPAFWQTTEIETAPALVEAGPRALRATAPEDRLLADHALV